MPLYVIIGTALAAVLSIGAAVAKVRLSSAEKAFVTVRVGDRDYEVREEDAKKLVEASFSAHAS